MKNNIVLLLLAASLSHPPSHAADGAQPAPAPEGIAACRACHGPNGISSSAVIPNLAGQKADYLVAQLLAFKKGDRKNSYMTVVAGQLSETEIPKFAQYWSSQPAAPESPQAAKALPAIPSRMSLPARFPSGYSVYETINDADSGVVIKRYANRVALRAARTGAELPDGSVIVVANYTAEKDASGALKAGAVRSYAGMESRAGWGDSVPALLKNGNWDYAAFNADGSRKDQLNQALCLACHKPVAADGYVFTMKALRAVTAKPTA
jgi:cytochrome c553